MVTFVTGQAQALAKTLVPALRPIKENAVLGTSVLLTRWSHVHLEPTQQLEPQFALSSPLVNFGPQQTILLEPVRLAPTKTSMQYKLRAPRVQKGAPAVQARSILLSVPQVISLPSKK